MALLLLPLVWLWPCVFGGNTFVPFDPAAFPPAALQLDDAALAAAKDGANYDVTEVLPWLLPEMELAQQEVARGEWPSWNPHARTGAPLHEVGVHGVLYPPHWLWLFGGDPKAWLVWLSWISLALAGLFAFGLLRKLEVSRPGAFFGAATFQLSGAMMTNAYFWTRLPGLCWLPALLWALLCLGEGERSRLGPKLAVAICLAMPWYAGFPPYATATTLLGLLLAVRLLLERLGRDGSAAALALLRRLAMPLLAGVLLTMPQVLPSFWFFAVEGARSATPAFTMSSGARFEYYGLLGYLIPDAFGHPQLTQLPANLNPLCYLWGNITDAAGKAVNPSYNHTEYAVYFGAAGLVLAGYGSLRGRGQMRGFVVISILLLLALALFLPLFRLAYHLPVLGNTAPMRWLAPMTLLLSWLCAYGFDRLARAGRRSLVRLSSITLVLAALCAWLTTWPRSWHAEDPLWPAAAIAERFAFPLEQIPGYFAQGAPDVDRFALATDQFAAAGWHAALWLLLAGIALAALAMLHATRARPWLLALLPLLSIVQLGSRGANLLHGHALAHGTDTEVHAFLRQQNSIHRDTGGITIARAGATLTIPSQLPPGQLMDPGIRDLNFYTHYEARSAEPLRAVLGDTWDRRWLPRGYLQSVLPDDARVLNHPLFDLLGLRYVLSTTPLQHAGRRVGPELKSKRGEFFLYERPTAMARAFTVPAVRTLPDDDAVVAAMAAASTRFAAIALVAGDGSAAPPVGSGPARTVTFTRDEPGVVELDIAAGAQPWLVLTDTWMPGWSASIDGHAVAIERCNHSMRLLQLPAERCQVRFEHAPPWLWPGIVLFAVGLGLLLVRRPSSGNARPVETTE